MSRRPTLLAGVLTTLAVIAALAPAAAAAGATSVKLTYASSVFRSDEAVFLRGKVLAGTEPAAGVRVDVLTRTPSGSWTRLTTVRSSRSGTVATTDRPTGTRAYRLRITGTSRLSGGLWANRTTRERTLASREAALSSFLGKATSGVIKRTRYGSTVRIKQFQQGVLTQVGARTPVVRGTMLSEWARRGGVGGRLGAPVYDAKCRLMEGACLQRFQNGTIYLNPKARQKVSVSYGTGRGTEIVATAWSQRGYTEPCYRCSKYSRWQTSDKAWCGIFLAWASHASGNGNAFPRADTFDSMLAQIKRSGMVRSSPAVGRLAFFGNPVYHVALVVEVRRSTIITIEGNIGADGHNSHPRGVFSFERSRSTVRYYASPNF